MLVLRRKEGQDTFITDKEGNVLRIRVYDIAGGGNKTGRVNLAFDDPERNFEIKRPEWAAKTSPNEVKKLLSGVQKPLDGPKTYAKQLDKPKS